MTEFKKYQRTAIAEMRPYVPGEEMGDISVSSVEVAAGSPKEGDMIARNPKNHEDQWLVAAAYFADNFAPLPEDEVQSDAMLIRRLFEQVDKYPLLSAEPGTLEARYELNELPADEHGPAVSGHIVGLYDKNGKRVVMMHPDTYEELVKAGKL